MMFVLSMRERNQGRNKKGLRLFDFKFFGIAKRVKLFNLPLTWGNRYNPFRFPRKKSRD